MEIGQTYFTTVAIQLLTVYCSNPYIRSGVIRYTVVIHELSIFAATTERSRELNNTRGTIEKGKIYVREIIISRDRYLITQSSVV